MTDQERAQAQRQIDMHEDRCTEAIDIANDHPPGSEQRRIPPGGGNPAEERGQSDQGGDEQGIGHRDPATE